MSGLKKSIIFLFIYCISSSQLRAAESSKYWIFFSDKPDAHRCQQSFSNQHEVRLDASVSRSEDAYDAPVSESYIDCLRENGAAVLTVSRWLNAVSCQIPDAQVSLIEQLDFVRRMQPVASFHYQPPEESAPAKTMAQLPGICNLDYGPGYAQVAQINVPEVHDLGFDGKGVKIGVLDSGFNWKERSIFSEITVLDEYDFYYQDSVTANEPEDVISQQDHGTYVLSVLGGYAPGQLIGPAYRASYILAKTEHTYDEYRIEEDTFIQGLEWVVEHGAEIVSISLGYNYFDDGFRYNYSDFDGDHAVTTIAADIAAQKGILIVNSAGNERGDPWGHILSPADGDSVLAIGAVDMYGKIANFSSPGPTADGRIKPDFCAMGFSAYCFNVKSDSTERFVFANGTSLSCPLVAGACALLKQARPELEPMEIREILRQTSSQSDAPDNDYGWGIIDTYKALFYHGMVFKDICLETAIDGGYDFSFHILTQVPVDQQSVTLFYRPNDSSPYATTTLTQSLLDKAHFFCALQGDFPDSTVQFYIEAADTAGRISHAPVQAPQKYYAFSLRVQDLDVGNEPPAHVTLHPNFPNPFRESTTFYVDLAAATPVLFEIFNIKGQHVKTIFEGELSRGQYPFYWNGRDDAKRQVGSGVYFCVLKTKDQKHVRKAMLLH